MLEPEFPSVLVVDDEESIRHVLRAVLERKGCLVREAGSAEAALALLDEFEPAIALLDIVLPGMNGLKLAKEIRARHPDCEVVMMTSQSSVETVVESIRQGAHDYLAKPFESLDHICVVVMKAYEKRTLVLRDRTLQRKREELSAELTSALARTAVGIDDQGADDLVNREPSPGCKPDATESKR